MAKEKIPTYSICNLLGTKNCGTDFLITRIADFVRENRCIHFPHRHSFYQIVLFTHGSGRHNIDFRDYEVMPHQIYYMAPNQIHTWDFSADTDGYLINFDENFFNSFLQNSQLIKKLPLFNQITGRPTQILEADCCIEIVVLFQKLLEEYEKEASFKQEILRSILLEILIRLSRTQHPTLKEGVTKHHFTVLQNFEELIEKHFLEKRLPKDYAELLFVTPNHLNSLCNTTVGKSAGELIRERILLEAKRLLVNSDHNISEIAYQLNFEDNAYFSRFFKKYVTESPENFRKKQN
jgi:AraC-like DNA-binding protein